MGSISGLGRSPGGGNGNPLQYSCLENPLEGGACWATVYVVMKESDPSILSSMDTWVVSDFQLLNIGVHFSGNVLKILFYDLC